MRLLPAVVVIALALAVVGVAATTAGTAAAQDQDHVEPCATEQPPDYAPPDGNDTIGWVPGPSGLGGTLGGGGDANGTTEGANATTNGSTGDANDTATPTPGLWYDEPIDVDHADGLDPAERNATVARTAARVEALRCLSFETVPSVTVINRSQLRATQRQSLYDRSAASRRFDDARLDAALLLDGNRNATEARVATRSAAVLAYYAPGSDEIVLVAENRSEPRIDEPTLAHELVHALQDQHFDLGRFDDRRTDGALAESGLIEGDAGLVETRYQDRCDDGAWTGRCLDAGTPASDATPHVGLQLMLYQPYNDGPMFVQDTYIDGGWPAVDDRYARPPATTRHVLAPETSDSFVPDPVGVTPSVSGDWERLRPPRGPAADVLGPATIGATLIAPTFDSDSGNVYPPDVVQHTRRGTRVDIVGPYRYNQDVVQDWRGGRLRVFTDDRNRTATVWRTVWESAGAAETFRERFVDLVGIRGGDDVRDLRGTYEFSGGSGRDGLVYVTTQGQQVVVVRGPDVEGLRGVYTDAAPATSEFEPSEDASGASRPTDAPDDGPQDDQLGLGLAVAGITLAAVVALARARRT